MESAHAMYFEIVIRGKSESLDESKATIPSQVQGDPSLSINALPPFEAKPQSADNAKPPLAAPSFSQEPPVYLKFTVEKNTIFYDCYTFEVLRD